MFQLAASNVATVVKDQMLAAIVDRLIDIDVEIRWEDIVRQEEANEKVYMFHMDLDDDSSDDDHSDGDGEGPSSAAALQHHQAVAAAPGSEMCLESVAGEFERQASALRLLDCRPALEANARLKQNLPATFGGDYNLNMFFPFDPYLLVHSIRYIKPIFIRPGSEGHGHDGGQLYSSYEEEADIEEVPRLGSSYLSDVDDRFDPMSFTPPAHLPPLPAALPPTLASRFR
eukprot:jgi/Mesen1/2877/ME000175S02035